MHKRQYFKKKVTIVMFSAIKLSTRPNYLGQSMFLVGKHFDDISCYDTIMQ